ncbi:glycosyltransferase family 9 protein [Actinomadura formosensis]|uniref:glycosyltransferase family 9 protein n=1 Tax=Actinomadura formosensis TaxID=60706 RepID=UPI000A005728|nr:glycosyltransferase family 9 protein [Actinomadura formosensis]
MSLPELPITDLTRPDCDNWLGYKPCAEQKAQQLANCAGCVRFEPGPESITVNVQPYDPAILEDAKDVGIVEMGGLGSILRTSAVSRAIRQINSRAGIHWFTHSRGADLLRYVPGVIPVDVEANSVEQYGDLVSKLDVLVNFESSAQAKPVVAQAQRVAGYALNKQGKFYGVRPHADRFQRLQIDDAFRLGNQQTMQEVLLDSVGLGHIEPWYDVALTESNRVEAENIVDAAFDGKPPTELLGVNIGTSVNGRFRRWPTESFVELTKTLAASYPEQGIMVLSGPEDDEVRTQFTEKVVAPAPNVAILPNRVEIGNFIGILSKLSVLVTSNTFALHAARSQDLPVVTFEGPLPPQEMELGTRDILLGPKLDCGPCYSKCTQLTPAKCMYEIKPSEVAEQVDSLIRN